MERSLECCFQVKLPGRKLLQFFCTSVCFKHSLALHGCRLSATPRGVTSAVVSSQLYTKTLIWGWIWVQADMGQFQKASIPVFQWFSQWVGGGTFRMVTPLLDIIPALWSVPTPGLASSFSQRLNHKCLPCWVLGHERLPQGSWQSSCFHTLCLPKPCCSQTEPRRYLSSMEISTCAQKPREIVSAPSLKVSKAAQGLEQPWLVDGMAGDGIRGFLKSLHTQTLLGFHDDSMMSSPAFILHHFLSNLISQI